MSVRFFLSISSPIVRTCENHSQFWHCTTTFTPIFWTYIVEREAKKWERNHSRHRFPTPRVGCSRLVVRCVYSVPIIFGVPMNLAPAAASMQARNWQPRNIHGMSPRNQPWKSDQLLLPVVFFFFWGVYNNLAVSQFISCLHLVYPIFFAASFLGTLGPVGRWPGLGWNHQIKVDEELPPPTERSRVETVHRSARVHCECLGWPCFCRGDDWHHAHYKKQNEGWAEFLCENICEGKAVSTSWKKASHASRTPLLRWPAGFVLIFCAAVSIYCDAFADVIGLFGACFGTLICIIWPLRRESFMVLPVSSVFDCLKMFKIYTGSLSREDCAWLYLTAHIFRFIKKIDLFHV